MWAKALFGLFSLFLLWNNPPCFSNSSDPADYRKVFGNDWIKAEAFISQNEEWMKSTCRKHGIDYRFAVAIVFPELVRYSALRDKIEITLLKALYTNLGEEYADFSIGPFQMKPSFAEKINDEMMISSDRKLRNQFRGRTSYPEPRLFRKSIVADLEDPVREFSYLIGFMRFTEKRFPRTWSSDSEKLRFFATAYNSGPEKSEDHIESMTNRKFFTTSPGTPPTWCYQDISLFWFNIHSAEDAATQNR